MHLGVERISRPLLHRYVADAAERVVRALLVGTLLDRAATVAAGATLALVPSDPQVALVRRKRVELAQGQAEFDGKAQVSFDLGVAGEKRSSFGSFTPALFSQ